MPPRDFEGIPPLTSVEWQAHHHRLHEKMERAHDLIKKRLRGGDSLEAKWASEIAAQMVF